ncbi:GGDEF domain-containing protein [uncultured Ferrimonas sp.]|uniref:GGDEF domain-containing protein n=1 Tax=uncultured Ferrimonas sp. TaxID=432640 RepID=UPI002605A948|nr:GGDEF domain-containing protein [uncultured Ferrimonas sp.]
MWIDFSYRETALAITNNNNIFELYYIAIAATALRYDRRLTLFAGALAIVSYGALVAYASQIYDSHNIDPRWLARYGVLYPTDLINRFLYLAMVTMLAWALVNRASQLEQEAIRDPLTGLFNRTFLNKHLELSLKRGSRDQQVTSLVMLDLDHFKHINDQYGHPAGDQILQQFSHYLQQMVRQDDVVARYGGEEFCLVFNRTSHYEVNQVLLKLQRHINNQSFAIGHGKHVSISFSGGVASSVDMSAVQLIEEADNALLQAKRQGRQRIILPNQQPLLA